MREQKSFAHKLKGSASTIGAMQLVRYLEDIEQYIVSNDKINASVLKVKSWNNSADCLKTSHSARLSGHVSLKNQLATSLTGVIKYKTARILPILILKKHYHLKNC